MPPTAAFLATKTKDEILQAAIAYRLLCIGICDTADLADSPQLAARELLRHDRRRRPGAHDAGAVGGRLGPVTELRRPAPLLGEHTDEVLRRVAGCRRARPLERRGSRR